MRLFILYYLVLQHIVECVWVLKHITYNEQIQLQHGNTC
mgnify:CR=1 FL=1